MAVKRIWHGWTTIEDADSYWNVLSGTVIPGIEAKSIAGYEGIEVLRREHESEVEFVTIMTFDSIQSVIHFQGEDYARSYVPGVARAVLKRWDTTAAHFEVLTRDSARFGEDTDHDESRTGRGADTAEPPIESSTGGNAEST